VRYLLLEIKGVETSAFLRMSYQDAFYYYGNDKPDLRFDIKFNYLKGGRENLDLVQGVHFNVFDNAVSVIAINLPNAAYYTRKQIDEWTDFVKTPQIAASGLVYCRVGKLGEHKSSVDKFYNQAQLQTWVDHCKAQEGDLLFMLSGDLIKTQVQLSTLRLAVGKALGLRDNNTFAPLWVVDFPLLEWDEEHNRFHAMHHPFTSPKIEDIILLETSPEKVRANAYDMVINGVELGGGSIRIFNKSLQSTMFDLLGFTKEEANAQFGFLMNAFEYGAPPHGGIAFGFDRLCSLLGGSESIRDYIAFPKNNMGRDVMIDAPSIIANPQLDELGIALKAKK